MMHKAGEKKNKATPSSFQPSIGSHFIQQDIQQRQHLKIERIVQSPEVQ